MDLSLAYLQKSPTAAALLQQAAAANPQINFVTDGIDSTSYNRLTNQQGPVSWDRTAAQAVKQLDGKVGVQSAALGLFHEILHVIDPNKFAGTEDFALQGEAKVAQELGEPIRFDYTGLLIREQNPTEHTAGGKWVEMESDGRLSVGGSFDGTVPFGGAPTGLAGGSSISYGPGYPGYGYSGGSSGGGGGGGGYYPYGDPL